MPVAVRYQFHQAFRVPAKAAFEWCTNFDPEDHTLMGDKAERKVSQIAEGSLLLKDTFHTAAGIVEKLKLVELYPAQRRWTSTHLSGPNKHSQFLYVINPKGKEASTLEFTALHIEHDEKVNAEQLVKRLSEEDAQAWMLLAAAMEKEKAVASGKTRKK
jgi:hypothetical protein